VAHPSLRVVREDANGVVISGMKMLATAAVYADEIWIGKSSTTRSVPLAESITCAIPIAMSGTLRSGLASPTRCMSRSARLPVSYRFDESDCVLVCEDVEVPGSASFFTIMR